MLSLDYVAGYIDGEGCITILYWQDKRRLNKKFNGYEFRPYFGVHTKDLDVIKQLSPFFDSYGIHTSTYLNRHPTSLRKYEPTHKIDCVNWDNIAKICNLLKPHVIAKKEVMKLFLEAYSIRKSPGRSKRGYLCSLMNENEFIVVHSIMCKIRKINKGIFYKDIPLGF